MSRRFDRFVLAEEGPVMEICPLLGRVGRCFQIGDTRAEGRLVWKYLAKIVEFFPWKKTAQIESKQYGSINKSPNERV